MGCRLSDFDRQGEWLDMKIGGHKIEMCAVKYRPIKYRGRLIKSPLDGEIFWAFKIDGRFQGVTGSPAAVLHCVNQTIADIESELARQTR